MEKRECKRKIRRLNITFTDGKEEYNGISSDFSCNGLFIRTRKSFNEGIKLKMQLEIENGKKIPLTGIVKRAIKTNISGYNISGYKNGMGIRLTSIPKEYDNFIKELYKE
ncbi:MAG: PilZ domain-containing protein [Nitrospirota bacterium]|nr:PilZ domain-containing protein [Nitrospirota bacterium]